MKVIDTLHRGEAYPTSGQDEGLYVIRRRGLPQGVKLRRCVEMLRVIDLLHEQNRALAEDANLVAGRSPAAAAATDCFHLVRSHHHQVGSPRLSQPDDFPRRLADERLGPNGNTPGGERLRSEGESVPGSRGEPPVERPHFTRRDPGDLLD